MGQLQMSIVAIQMIGVLYQASFWISSALSSADSSSEALLEKQSAYECGFEPVGDARMKFEIVYYVIGILYLIQDQEQIFQFPFATIIINTSKAPEALSIFMIFLIIISIGFIYEYQVGALDQSSEGAR